jgi:hypothetical protein
MLLIPDLIYYLPTPDGSATVGHYRSTTAALWCRLEMAVVVTHKRETNAKNLVIKIMRDEVGKATESDPN